MAIDNRLFDLFAFAVTAYIAFALEWKPNELCWGLWISSLTVGWVVIVLYLMANYWAMILGILIARRRQILAGNPGENIKAVYSSVVRIHIFILLSAFLSFLVYFGFEIYNQVLLLILLGLFFYTRRSPQRRTAPG